MKLVKQIDFDIPVLEMKDGDIAVIKSWRSWDRYVGTIVQRYGDYLIAVGKPEEYGWGEFFFSSRLNNKSTSPGTVQILPTGTQFEI